VDDNNNNNNNLITYIALFTFSDQQHFTTLNTTIKFKFVKLIQQDMLKNYTK